MSQFLKENDVKAMPIDPTVSFGKFTEMGYFFKKITGMIDFQNIT